jgi:hypothetical protein
MCYVARIRKVRNGVRILVGTPLKEIRLRRYKGAKVSRRLLQDNQAGSNSAALFGKVVFLV